MLASRTGASILRSAVRQPIRNPLALTRSVGQRGYASLVDNVSKASDRTWLLTSLGISLPIGFYLVTNGSAKKKPIGHGKEHEGYKSHDEHKEEEASGKKTYVKEKLKETSSDNKNMDFKTPDESNSQQSNQRDRLKDDKSAGELGTVSEASSDAGPKPAAPSAESESEPKSGLPDSLPGASSTEKAIGRE
ncbi:hypothetical protein QBC32DRAFT_351256 [Pseudoneurospora amorphoporcata]|uniref:Uncharacterized protein n=1 Tax=Pseudoneurospora amorphoporcata TaxID=241081 RepID=A0AAN6NMG0_9PEZI|nr:hypothetical protein QBC32DRAFT_351256 [Pseudoneurospora amorphoporcata]